MDSYDYKFWVKNWPICLIIGHCDPPFDKNLHENGKILKLGIKPVFYFYEILLAYAYFIAYVY